MNLIEHDTQVAKAFIQAGKRDRFLSTAACRECDSTGKVTAASRKKLNKYQSMLANLEHWLDPERTRLPIGRHTQHADAKQAFAQRTANLTVYVMSCDDSLDGRILSLEHILEQLSKRDIHGTLAVSIDGCLAYYEQCELAELTQLLSSKKH